MGQYKKKRASLPFREALSFSERIQNLTLAPLILQSVISVNELDPLGKSLQIHLQMGTREAFMDDFLVSLAA